MMERSDEIDRLGADHPGADELLGYVHGELSQREARSVREHAAGCRNCGDQLAALILLRETQLNVENGKAPSANVTLFPLPTKAPVRRWPLPAVAAAVAALIFALGWFMWPPPAGQPTEEDRHLVAEASGDIGPFFDLGTRSAAAGDVSDDVVVGIALSELMNDDLQSARNTLERFGERERWHRFGTALLGYVLFLQEDPYARSVLEMYRAGHDTKSWEDGAIMPEDLAFFFLARLRFAGDDDVGASEVVALIYPGSEVGQAAVAWAQKTLPAPIRESAPDNRP